MDYCKKILGKSIVEISYQDIEIFFQEEKQETDFIEFKSFSSTYGNFDKNLEKVIIGISAFLNSSGGILIWGAPEGVDVTGRSHKIFQGELSPVKDIKEKDWLINKISDSITPMPIGVRVERLGENENYVYVFEIDPSLYKPHQNKNKIYYARFDGQSRPAPHYLIQALFQQVHYPNLEGYIKLDRLYNDGYNLFINLSVYLFNFSQLINEENVSYTLTCDNGIFIDNFEFINYTLDNHQCINKGNIDVLHYGSPYLGSHILKFIPSQTSSHNNLVRIILTLGGKSSPLKKSIYKLSLAAIDWSKSEEPSFLITDMQENTFFHEEDDKIGRTKENIVKLVLNR